MSVASHGFGPEMSWGTLSCAVFCCILFDWETLCVCLFAEWTPASPAKSIVSQIKAWKQQFLMQNHVRHGLWGWTMDLTWFTSVGEIYHVGNVDSLGLNLESSGLNSVLLRSGAVQLVFPYVDLWRPSSAMFCMIFMANVLKTQALLAGAVCILVPEWSLQWCDVIQETDFGSLESCISKAICPTWATSTLLLSWVSVWLLRSPQ